MLNLLLGIPLSLLPEFYRRRWFRLTTINFTLGTVLSGLLECAAFGWFFVHGYEEFIHPGHNTTTNAMGSGFSIGAVSLMDYVFQPLPFFNAYLMTEGLIRFSSAFVTGEHWGTLPLYLLGQAHRGIAYLVQEARLGPRIADEVERGDGREYDLRIASCRPKENWDGLMTVEYEQHFYEVVFGKLHLPPRRFVYFLREKPAVKVIRGLHSYSPDEVLPPRRRQPSEAPAGSQPGKG